MRKVTIGENGELKDAETGEVIGKRGPDGKIIPNPQKAPVPENKGNSHNKGKNEGNPADSSENTSGSDSEKGSVPPDKTIGQPPKPATNPSHDVKTRNPQLAKYEVTPESEFTVRFCIGFKEGRVQIYQEDAYLKFDDLERHWVTFRMWKYEEELAWQNQAMEFQGQTRSFILNQGKLNEIKIRHLIKSWSFEEYDPKFKLLHVGGVLSDESYSIFKGFFPTIINNVIYLMNQVLENNG